MKLRQKGWRRGAELALLVLVLLLAPPSAGLAGRAAPQVTTPAELAFPVLSADGEPLRSAFNRDADKVRLLFLIDPT